MNAVWTIAWREMRERRSLVLAIVVLGLLLFVLRLVPGVVGEVGSILALFVGASFPPAVALALGGSVVGRDMGERRLGFYLARPISTTALWFGKFLGGSALSLLALALVGGALVVEARVSLFAFLVLAPLVLLCLMGASHVAVSSYRSRSPLAALDLALLIVFALGSGWALRDLFRAGAGVSLLRALPVMLAVTVAILLASGMAQLASGRLDLRRGHAALSATVWPLLFVQLACFGAWGNWVLGVTPDETGAGYQVLVAPRGDALFFNGHGGGRAGYSPMFLMDAGSGAYLRLDPSRVSQPVFSPDGRTAVWVEEPVWPIAATTGTKTGMTLGVARLLEGAPRVGKLAIPALLDGVQDALAVSDDGLRALVSASDSVLAVVDLESGGVVGQTRIDPAQVHGARFLADGQARLFRFSPWSRTQQLPIWKAPATVAVVDWDPVANTSKERIIAERVTRALALAADENLVLLATGEDERALIDLETGARRATFPGPWSGLGIFLSDGRLAIVIEQGGAAPHRSDSSPPLQGTESGAAPSQVPRMIQVVARTGETLTSLPIPSVKTLRSLIETAPGEVAVGYWGFDLDQRHTAFLDLATGVSRRDEKGLVPEYSPFGVAGARDPWGRPAPGSLASRLYRDENGDLIELQPEGRRRVLVRAPVEQP